MASRVVLQPNGLYARFSDVVDDFTHVNMDRASMIFEYMFTHNLSGEEARSKLERADIEAYRFADSLRTVRVIHGYGAMIQRLRSMDIDPRKWRRAAKWFGKVVSQ